MLRSTSRTRRVTTTTVVAFAAVLAVGAAAAVAKFDSGFGVDRDNELANHSEKLFGVCRPLAELVGGHHPGRG
jgi:hypothetical protein